MFLLILLVVIFSLQYGYLDLAGYLRIFALKTVNDV